MFSVTFAEEFDPSYYDWTTFMTVGDDVDGVSYESYFISGYKVHAEGDKKFQSNYVTLNYGDGVAVRENESAYFSAVWGYSVNSDTNKWSTEQQIVLPLANRTDYRYGTRKLKVRGTGKALQFKTRSEEGKPFFINGWTVLVTGNTNV